MKKILFLLFLLCTALQSTFSYEFDKSNHPKHLGANNWGMEFYFTFLPCYENKDKEKEWFQKIYITSNVRTRVKVEVLGRKFEEIKYTIPNEIIEFALKPLIAMPVRKEPGEKPQPEEVIPDYAIHIVSDDPIICYALTDNTPVNQSEGFLVLPVHTLGKDYVISSFLETSPNSVYYPSYTSITGIYDSTIVQFALGGQIGYQKTGGGQKAGDTTTWIINSGDVIIFGSTKNGADLSGSKIIGSKPISVISGNFCFYYSTEFPYSNYGFTTEMEIPIKSWGLYYNTVPLNNKNINNVLKLFACDSNTAYYFDNIIKGYIEPPGQGLTGSWSFYTGFFDSLRPSTISAKKPINITRFRVGIKDSLNEIDPYQMALLPVEQYQKEITLLTPSSKNRFNNYLEIQLICDEFGNIIDDYQIGIYNKSQSKFIWLPLMEYQIDDLLQSNSSINNTNYTLMKIKLPIEGVFKLRADKPFQAYSYGFSAYDGYGFPSSASLKKLGKNDNQPPVPQWAKDCNGNVNSDNNVFVYDLPNDTANRSNLALIYMHSDVSFNYKFNLEQFFPCDSSQAKWSLDIIDSTQDALAVITFADCYGNDTTLVIEHYHRITSASDSVLANQNIVLGNDYWKQFSIKNNSVNTWYCDEYKFKNNQAFSLWNLDKTEPLAKQFKLNTNDSIQFFVKCDGKKEGDFTDSLGFLNDCEFSYDIALNTKVGIPILEVSDLNFNPSNINDTVKANFKIKNIGSVNLEITKIKAPTLRGTSKKKIFMLSGIDFGEISKMNPLILASGEELELTIEFSPDDTIHFSDSIVFNSNSFKQDSKGNIADSICKLSGKSGINISVRDPKYSEIKLYPNPTDDMIMLENLPEKTTTVQIFDESGKVIKEIRIANPTEMQKISTKELSSGNYILRLVIDREIMDFKIVVI